MKFKAFIVLALVSLIGFSGVSQTIEGYSFATYKTSKIHTGKKAKIDYKSNPVAREFKTVITEDYKSGHINFAGHYIAITWGCGTGCMGGAMVNTLDGKVYELPLGETTFYYGCDLEDEDGLSYTADSRLFITMMCSESELLFEKTYLINVWDEAKKKFILLEKINRNVAKNK